jgi:hypothetical protein
VLSLRKRKMGRSSWQLKTTDISMHRWISKEDKYDLLPLMFLFDISG